MDKNIFMVPMLRLFSFLALIALPCVTIAQDTTASGEAPIATARISYNPELSGLFKNLDDVRVVYVANFWNTRRGTRLALRENIFRPDSSRLMIAPLVKAEGSWTAELQVPPNAAVLSYYITDGEAVDDNNGETFTAYVYAGNGMPVPNAHYFMVPFLELAGAGLEERLRESEQELLAYPENFRAYTQYFTLYMELERGSERVQARIVQRLNDLEEKYGESNDCLNLIARTYYYVLRNQETGLAYKERIPQRERWPEVEAMFDIRSHEQEQRERVMERERTRAALMNADAPQVNFILDEGRIAPEDLKGDPVVMVFWATTSELSVQLFKGLADLHARYAGKGLKVFTINAGEDQEAVDRFKKQHDYPFIWALNNGAAILLYGVTGLPQTYIIDKQGIIRDIVVGYQQGSLRKIAEAVEKVL